MLRGCCNIVQEHSLANTESGEQLGPYSDEHWIPAAQLSLGFYSDGNELLVNAWSGQLLMLYLSGLRMSSMYLAVLSIITFAYIDFGEVGCPILNRSHRLTANAHCHKNAVRDICWHYCSPSTGAIPVQACAEPVPVLGPPSIIWHLLLSARWWRGK